MKGYACVWGILTSPQVSQAGGQASNCAKCAKGDGEENLGRMIMGRMMGAYFAKASSVALRAMDDKSKAKGFYPQITQMGMMGGDLTTKYPTSPRLWRASTKGAKGKDGELFVSSCARVGALCYPYPEKTSTQRRKGRKAKNAKP